MTDEQIKQNKNHEDALLTKAREFMEHNYGLKGELIYIEGAHSRDGEIKELEQAIAFAEDVVDAQKKELDKLRNPWISVEERLPQESKKYKGWLSDTVFVITNKNDGTSARYNHATKTWCPAKILQGSITHWMPMLQIEKGE